LKQNEQSVESSIQSVIFQTLTLCILLLAIATLVMEHINADKVFRQNINNLSSLVARYSVPTLLFNNKEEAVNTLNTLEVDKRIIKAKLTNKSGQTFAETVFPNRAKLENAYIIYIDIQDNGINLGQLTLWIDLSSQQFNLIKVFFLLLVLSSVCFALAYFLSQRLPSPVTAAISDVADIFKNITQTKNFHCRAEKSNIREMNTIINGLNTMLEQILDRDYELRRHKERLEVALKSSGEGIWEFNPNSKLITNDHTTQLITTNKQQIAFNNKLKNNYQAHYISWLKRFHHEDRVKISRYINKLFDKSINGFNLECRLYFSKTSYRWVNIHGLLSYNQANFPMSVIGTIIDIHERRKATQENELLSAIFQKTQDPVVVINGNLIIQAANAAFTQQTHHMNPQGKQFEHFFDAHYHERHFFKHMKNTLLQNKTWEGELRFSSEHEEKVPLWLSIVPISKEDNLNYLCTFSKLTQRQSIEDELRYLAHYDSLTDLPNRRMFNDRLAQCIKASRRNNYKFSLIFIDIDDFKSINDTLGHKVGDEVLMIIAKSLKIPLRDSDTVARLGGDEFIVLLEQCGPRDQVAIVTERLFDEISKPLLIQNHKFMLTASIGVAYYPDDGINAEELMINADLAMYRSKKDKRSPYRFFKSEWGKIAERQSKLRNALASAIKNEEFFIALQPKFNLQTLQIESAEALIRWVHPEYGFISPVEFIPLAEDSGFIEVIGNWVLHQVSMTLEQWKNTKLSHIHIAVNVSAVQFDEDKLLKELSLLSNCYNFPINRLELELTESILLKSESKAVDILTQINDMGFSISIDDFGTGYSSLQYLSKFPVQALKIDRSFIMNFENDPRNATIVKAIIAMAKGLEMQVIAEGIETFNQLQLLTDMGANTGQGYWCSEPIKTSQFESFIPQWQNKISEGELPNRAIVNE